MLRRTLGIIGLILSFVVFIVVVAALVISRSDWGHERVRRYVLEALNDSTKRIVRIGGIEGDLFHGAKFVHVVITDNAGQPFVKVDTLVASYRFLLFIKKRIDLDNVRLVRPDVVLDRQPGGKWNFDRIFPRDTTHRPGPPGFGSWITLRNATIIDGRLIARSPWKPSDTLSARARDSVIRFNLGPMGRQNIVEVPGGYQRIAEFRRMTGKLPYLRLADPDDARQLIDVETLRAEAQPMRPPVVQVTNLTGRFTILGDSVYFTKVKAALSGSQIVGDGRYMISNSDLRLRLRADPVATNDLLWIDPNIPHDGKGALDVALDWVGTKSDYRATNTTLAVAGARLRGKLGMLVTDTISFHDTDVEFARLDTRTIGKLFPTLQSPRQGYLTGRMKAKGGLGLVTMDGDVIFDDPTGGRSHVFVVGAAGGDKTIFRAKQLKLIFEPVQVDLARTLDPKLPIDGVVSGTMMLDGATKSRLNIISDITHSGTTGTSRVSGAAAYADNINGAPFLNADLQLDSLSLLTVGAFAPAAGLRGALAGPVKLTGPMQNLTLNADLRAPDGGAVVVTGTGRWTRSEKVYDIVGRTLLFNASTVSSKAPSTSLTADMTMRGSGITPETINAAATLNVQTSTYDSVTVDSARVRVHASDGLLTVDTLALQIPHARANVSGTFGLIASKRGELGYAIHVDSLSALSRYIPKDTGVVTPRPAILAERIRRARADSARRAQETAVVRAATGGAAPKLVIDTPKVIPKALLAGIVDAKGTLSGNVKAFDVKGVATGQRLVALGHSANGMNARYTWINALTPQSKLDAGVTATHVLASGFALDTVMVSADYQRPNGVVNLTIGQDSKRRYSIDAKYNLHRERNEVRLDNARFVFDTVVYTTPQASVMHYGPNGMDIDRFELRAPNGSGVLLTGSLPKTGNANLALNVREFDVANLFALMQTGIVGRGLVSLTATASGTAANPTMKGAFGASNFSYGSTPLPEVHGTFDYANQTLTASFGAAGRGRRPFLNAQGTVPINLSLETVKGSRIPVDRQIDATVITDSLPLDMVPEVSDVISNLTGQARANFTVRGTVNRPDINGVIALNNAEVTVIPTGVRYAGVNANIRLLSDTLVIDSVVARSGGTLKLVGGIGLKSLAAPSFALTLTGRKVRVLDSDDGMLRVNANLNMRGPFKQAALTGDVRVLDGVIYVPEPTGKTLIGAGDPNLYAVADTTNDHVKTLFPTTSPLMKNLRVDVRVAVNRDVFARSRDFNVEAYTENEVRVTMDQSKQVLLLDGVVLSERGEYRFQGRRFQVRQGMATFANLPGLNPAMQITAEYEVQLPSREPITIRILVAGTLNSPRISLESDAQPPIPQTDLLSYLAFGRTSSSLLQLGGSGLTSGGSGSSNLVGQSATLAAQQVSAAALGAMTDQLASEIAKSIRADVLYIAPAEVSLDAGSFLRGTAVEFGKYIQRTTFLGLQFRLDPSSLKRPGVQATHRFGRQGTYRLETSFEPRYLPRAPTLSQDQVPTTTSVFGLFFVREWRY